MGKLNRRIPAKKYCECIDHCGTEIPLHCHFAPGHHLRGATPHNKGKKREEYLSPEAIASIITSATGRTRREESNAQTSASLLKFYEVKGKQRESRNCDYCGTLFERYPCFFHASKKHHFCSKQCSDSWRSENSAGSNNPKWKPKVVVACAYCKKPLEVYPCKEKQHNFCDKSCGTNWRILFSQGENNPNWRGGSSYDDYKGSFTESLRLKIKSRDDFQCQVCGNTEGDIHVHHIDYQKSNYDDMNLITLCNSCHSKTNGNRQYWQKRLVDIMEVKAQRERQSLVNFWLSRINPNITGSGYIPDPKAYQQEIRQQFN